MTLLVVGNYQAVDVERIPWTTLEAVTLIHVVKGSVIDIKNILRAKCREYGIPLYVQFAVPPLDYWTDPVVVPTELLRGFGLHLSGEVILYDECINAVAAATPNQVTETGSNVPRT